VQSPRLARAASEGSSPAGSSVSTPRSARAGDGRGTASADGGVAATAPAPANPAAQLLPVEEGASTVPTQSSAADADSSGMAAAQPAAQPAHQPADQPAEAVAEPAAESAAEPPPPAVPTPPESPMSPARESTPVSAKILAAEAGTMSNAKSTYKTPAPELGGGFGASDYEPPAPGAERSLGGKLAMVPAAVAPQDSPRPGSVRELSATFGPQASLSRSGSGASDDLFPRFRGGAMVGRAHSMDGSDTALSDIADFNDRPARVNRRSSLGAPPVALESLIPIAAHEDGNDIDDDDDDDFGTFEEAGDAPAAAAAAAGPVSAGTVADEQPSADADGFGTFEEAEPDAVAGPVISAPEPVAAAADADDEDDGFADFEDAAGGDDDGFGAFDAAPTAPPVAQPPAVRHYLH